MVRPSTTSRRTSSRAPSGDPAELRRLIEELPPDLREQVYTHSAWAADRSSSYERLEFLGDSVLELAIARALYDRFPDFSEGRLAKIRSHVVSRQSCAVVGRELELGAGLSQRGDSSLPPDELAGLARNGNVLAAILEAALAALFLEHGYPTIEPAIQAAFSGRIEYAATQHVDHKTELQEVLARQRRQVSYSVVEVEGPAHDRTFTCSVSVDGEQAGLGRGRSKKDAEQIAAREALEKLSLEAQPVR
ncbi:MAG: ribonuclease III [Gaiellaceae bacterium]